MFLRCMSVRLLQLTFEPLVNPSGVWQRGRGLKNNYIPANGTAIDSWVMENNPVSTLMEGKQHSSVIEHERVHFGNTGLWEYRLHEFCCSWSGFCLLILTQGVFKNEVDLFDAEVCKRCSGRKSWSRISGYFGFLFVYLLAWKMCQRKNSCSPVPGPASIYKQNRIKRKYHFQTAWKQECLRSKSIC